MVQGVGRAGRVVVVDDDADWRELVVQFLCDAGYEALGFSNGREALAALRRGGRPALILLDLEMPGMTGWEFRREQLRDPRLAVVPVVIASGAEPGPLDADAFLAKPFGPAELGRVVARLVAPSIAA
jgi:CheY-like chemotaxis protein